jgi:hypothetical protein
MKQVANEEKWKEKIGRPSNDMALDHFKNF